MTHPSPARSAPAPAPAPGSPNLVAKTSRVFYFMNLAGIGLMGLLMAWMHPHLRRLLADFRDYLPQVTRWVLGLPAWWWLVVSAALIAGLVVKEFLVRNKTTTLIIEVAVAVFVGVLLGAYLLAIVPPVWRLYKQMTP